MNYGDEPSSNEVQNNSSPNVYAQTWPIWAIKQVKQRYSTQLKQSGGRLTYQDVRGWSNNNPGNIRWNEPWAGAVSKSTYKTIGPVNVNENGDYIVFEHAFWGIRAIACDLWNKYRGHLQSGKPIRSNGGEPVKNISTLVPIWAPKEDNNKNNRQYMEMLVRKTGKSIHEDLNLPESFSVHKGLVVGIMTQESIGAPPYPDELIDAAVKAARQT